MKSYHRGKTVVRSMAMEMIDNYDKEESKRKT